MLSCYRRVYKADKLGSGSTACVRDVDQIEIEIFEVVGQGVPAAGKFALRKETSLMLRSGDVLRELLSGRLLYFLRGVDELEARRMVSKQRYRAGRLRYRCDIDMDSPKTNATRQE